MSNSSPNPIKDYYIAYFDILGYKAFFENHAEKVTDFQSMIHECVQQTLSSVSQNNQSKIAGDYGNIKINMKIFSDCFLLCMETSDMPTEPVRIMAFLQTIADIQLRFVNGYGLFVRGGIVIGKMSYNDDYVFGKGVIEAVTKEGEAQYPRIVIDKILVDKLTNYPQSTQEDNNRAFEIKKRYLANENITEDERLFYNQWYSRLQLNYAIQQAVPRLIISWPDDFYCLCYLTKIQLQDFIDEQLAQEVMRLIEQISPEDGKIIHQPIPTIDQILLRHKEVVEEQLKKYGSNADISNGEIRKADEREKTLRKYIWVMAFHNLVCGVYQKPEYIILARCNCDARFLKTTIEVLKEEKQN